MGPGLDLQESTTNESTGRSTMVRDFNPVFLVQDRANELWKGSIKPKSRNVR